MKKFRALAALSCALSVVMPLLAQPSVADENHFYVYHLGGGNFSSNVPLNEMNAKAFRFFVKKYPDADQEKWFVSSKGITVVFGDSNCRWKIFFDRKGNFTLSQKICAEQTAPAELKSNLENSFPDYHIMTSTENFDGRKVLYDVILENDDYIKSVEVDNGKITVLDEFRNDTAR